MKPAKLPILVQVNETKKSLNGNINGKNVNSFKVLLIEVRLFEFHVVYPMKAVATLKIVDQAQIVIHTVLQMQYYGPFVSMNKFNYLKKQKSMNVDIK